MQSRVDLTPFFRFQQLPKDIKYPHTELLDHFVVVLEKS